MTHANCPFVRQSVCALIRVKSGAIVQLIPKAILSLVCLRVVLCLSHPRNFCRLFFCSFSQCQQSSREIACLSLLTVCNQAWLSVTEERCLTVNGQQSGELISRVLTLNSHLTIQWTCTGGPVLASDHLRHYSTIASIAYPRLYICVVLC
jgi:hypothetical protein